MTVWKVEIFRPVTGPVRIRRVIEAASMDAAITKAKKDAGAPGSYGSAAQAMDDIELANREDATAHFGRNGFFPIYRKAGK